MTSANLIGWREAATIAGREARPERIGFYVSVKNGPRTGLLLGPYNDHGEALANVDRGYSLASDADVWAIHYAYGTCKITSQNLPQSTFGV